MPRNWQELYEDEVDTSTPMPRPSWQQNYEPSLGGVKQAVEPNLMPELGLASQGLQYGLGRLKAWRQGWDDWTRRQQKIQAWQPMSGEPAPPEMLDEMAGGGPFQPGSIGGVVRGLTSSDTGFVNYVRGQFPKLMKRVDELPDIQFTRGWRHITKPDSDEAKFAAQYTQPHSMIPSPGGEIEIGRPFQVMEGKWKKPFGPHPITQDPVPREWPRYREEVQGFVHEALHALYYHKTKGLSERGMERLGPEFEGAVPSMTYDQAVSFLKDMVKQGYVTEARMNQYVDGFMEARHGAMDAQSAKIVADVFEPWKRKDASRAKRENRLKKQ